MNGEGEAPDVWLDPKVGEHPETERRNGRPARLVARKARAVEKEYVRDATLGAAQPAGPAPTITTRAVTGSFQAQASGLGISPVSEP
jgi:hypothetical protein